ncbi:MAG: hypothetical protein AB7F86_05340 [Bdellovibrionales bacterium]
MRELLSGKLALILLALSALMDWSLALPRTVDHEAKLDKITVAGVGTGTCIGKTK